MEFMSKNEIYYQNMRLIGREKRGLPYNQWTYVFDGVELSGSNFKRGTTVTIKCNGNNKLYEREFKESWFKQEWFSQSHQSSGKKNGMFGKPGPNLGKVLSDDTKRKIGKASATRCYSKEINSKKGRAGPLNAFYGKNHSQQTKELISANRKGKCTGKDNPFYGKTHTQETIGKITLAGDKWRQENPELSYEFGLKGWQNSIFSRIQYGRKTSIERKTENKLKELGFTDFNFSQILNRKYQYDFRIGSNILLEVHGDYWHGNPKKYGGKLKPLNEQQKNKIAQDIIKQKYAIDNGWKLYVIWETDINNNNWTILEELLNEIRIN